MRVEWTLDSFDLAAFRREFSQTAAEFQMRWQLKSMSEVPRVAILVSQHLHCLADLLHRYQAGELHCTIPLVIGNHPDISKSLFAPGYTLASVIANEFSEATGDLYLSSLIEIGLALFLVTIVVNAIARGLVWAVTRGTPSRAH